MKKITTLLLLLINSHLFAQSFPDKELTTAINEVTVFQNSAQIFESGKVSIPKGTSVLRIKGLTPYLDEKSIQVKAEGDFVILAVNHKLNYFQEVIKDSKIDSLKKQAESIEDALDRENAKLEVLKEKQSLLNANKDLGGINGGATVAQLKAAIDFYESEVSKIKEEEMRILKSKEVKQTLLTKIENQRKELNEQRTLPTSEIEVRVQAARIINAEFKVTYLTNNAGWYPKYDIRVKNIQSPLTLTYKAEVFQNTGVDWKNVKLRFSNGNPNQSGVVPELNAWLLNYARNTVFDKSPYGYDIAGGMGTVRGKVLDEGGEVLPGVNVVVKGTTIGTVTDVNGYYSLTLPNGASTLNFSFIGLQTQEVPINKPEINVKLQYDQMQLQEVVVTGYGSAVAGSAPGIRIRGNSSINYKEKAEIVTTRVIENQTTVEIEVQTPYTIKSNGEKLQVDLKNHEIDALYEYYAIPKLDKDAFLIARIINWDQYNLLEGEANLYFEDAFIGRSILDAKALQDTLNISLGRDRNIVIGREKNDQFTKKKVLGSNVVETRGFNIVVRNKKSQAIKLTLFDQIPVSVINDISVNVTELSGGILDEQLGKITWELQLDPQQQKELKLEYQVKYPRREKVVLE